MFVPKQGTDQGLATEEMEIYFADYQGKSTEFKDSVSFESYLSILGKKIGRNSKYYDNRHFQKMQVPMFNGKNMTARAWLQKLQTYFTLCPIAKEDAIQFATIYLEEAAYDWWHHGLTTQGHEEIITFDEFSQRVLDRFEKKDEEEYFRELATLQQTTTVEAYIEEFQKISVMVTNISDKRVSFLFI